MIEFKPTDSEQLVGRIIFHATRGTCAALSICSPGERLIGARLGKVNRVNGPNRIYYLDQAGAEHYISMIGVGFVCDTANEALAIEDLGGKVAAEVAQALREIRQSCLKRSAA